MTEFAGALATAAMQAGHAVLAERGEWVLNEKRLLDRAGLRGVDSLITGDLVEAARRARELLGL